VTSWSGFVGAMLVVGMVGVGGIGGCCSTQAAVEGLPPAQGEPPEAGQEGAPEGVAAVPVELVAEAPKAKDGALVERCTVPRDFAGMSFEEGQSWRAGCKEAFDCTAPLSPMVCCAALLPACVACVDRDRATKAAFDYACFGATEAVPQTFDCASPPPLTPCCRALTPRCLDCAAKNRFIGDNYRKQCEK